MRQVVLDTETTGLEPENDHRIIEIGCVELNNRRLTGNDLHLYIQPDRPVDAGALDVHGITDAFLQDKPRFAEIAKRLLDYVADAELIIHNAPFDLAFLDAELARLEPDRRALAETRQVTDTLVDARRRFPGQRNSLDALCKRFVVDNAGRTLHGALLDAQLLAEVYCAMTGGQTDFSLDSTEAGRQNHGTASEDLAARLARAGKRPRTQNASHDEITAHQAYLAMMAKAGGEPPLWQTLDEAAGNAASDSRSTSTRPARSPPKAP